MGIEHRDIVVVGAGPAGSAAARAAACAGLSPLLVERDSSPGAGNACGGLASYAFRDKLGLGPDVIDHEIRRLRLSVDGSLSEFSGKRPGYLSFRRSRFDAFLAARAAEAGAELVTSTRAKRVDAATRQVTLEDLDTGHERDVRARVIIFADGPRTLAADSFGIGYRRERAAWDGLVLELEGSYGDGETVEIVVDTSALGYFWIFPKADCVHVGVGGPIRGGSPSLAARVSRFLQSRPDLGDRRVLSKNAGLMPGHPAEKIVADGAMVVGDAAGLVNPVTGGGIAFALLSGDIAGRAAAAAVVRGRTDAAALRRYPRRLRTTPHHLWLKAMTFWWGRLDRLDPAERPAAYGRMLRRYFAFFHAMAPLAKLLLKS